MRNVSTWEAKQLPKFKKAFTPRITRDLKHIPWPESLPEKIESLYLYGDTETGKTIYSAFLVLQERKNLYLAGNTEPYNILFISFPEMFIDLQNTFNNPDINLKDVLDRFKKADLLVIDDFGMKSMSNWSIEMLYVIINYRYEELKKTIITSNHSLKELAIILKEDTIVSRIERMCKISKKKKYKS